MLILVNKRHLKYSCQLNFIFVSPRLVRECAAAHGVLPEHLILHFAQPLVPRAHHMPRSLGLPPAVARHRLNVAAVARAARQAPRRRVQVLRVIDRAVSDKAAWCQLLRRRPRGARDSPCVCAREALTSRADPLAAARARSACRRSARGRHQNGAHAPSPSPQRSALPSRQQQSSRCGPMWASR